MSILGLSIPNVFFNRTASITVGILGLPGKKFTDLRMVFRVEKTSIATPNTAKIEIYNLNPQSRALFELPKATVILQAGYGEHAEVLFSGNVSKVKHVFKGPDIVTSMESGDGMLGYQNAVTDMSFGQGTPPAAVFTAVAASFLPHGVTPGQQQPMVGEPFLNGLTLSGSSRDHMDMLAERTNTEWSIQNQELQVLRKGVPKVAPPVLISSLTGMVGSPAKKDLGIEFISLMNPKIEPGKLVVIASKLIKGTFNVQKVVATGDTHGVPWYCECEAV